MLFLYLLSYDFFLEVKAGKTTWRRLLISKTSRKGFSTTRLDLYGGDLTKDCPLNPFSTEQLILGLK